MRQPLTQRRRKIARLGGTAAAIGGSLNVMHAPHGADLRYSVLGLVAGLAIGAAILPVARNRRKCQDSRTPQH